MKNLATPIIFLFFFLDFIPLNAQNNFSKKLADSLGNYWNMKEIESGIEFKSKDSAWTYNAINMPPFRNGDEFMNYLKAYGQHHFLNYSINYEPIWPPEKFKEARENNALEEKELSDLFQKLRINTLNHKFDSYVASNPDEEKRLKQYEKAREENEKRIVRLPDFEAAGMSWFLPEFGYASYSGVYPEELGALWFRLPSIIRNCADKIYGH